MPEIRSVPSLSAVSGGASDFTASAKRTLYRGQLGCHQALKNYAPCTKSAGKERAVNGKAAQIWHSMRIKCIEVAMASADKRFEKKVGKPPKPWRVFEETVAAIEKTNLPPDAVVTSPDKAIIDKVTGDPREVDVSIRYTVGTHPILIAIQCRDKGRKQGPGWIEEINTWTHDIGANLVVAVSRAGFTASAIKKAKHHGIRTRSLANVTPEEVATWTSLAVLTLDITVWRIRAFGPVFAEENSSRVQEFVDGIKQSVQPDNYQDTVVAHVPSAHRDVTFNDLVQNWAATGGREFVQALPADAQWKPVSIQSAFRVPHVAKHLDGTPRLAGFRMDLDVCRATQQAPAGGHIYTDEETGQVTRHEHWSADIAKMFPNGGGVPLIIYVNGKRIG